MKRLSLLLLTIALIYSCQPQKAKIPSPDDFVIFKGTNIAHWLSQSARRGVERDSFFTENDIVEIRKMGFDHIRLPIDEVQMWDENGMKHEDAFALLTNCIDWCLKHELRVVVDLHIIRSHYFNAEVKPLWTEPVEQEKFHKLWSDLSAALINYPVDMLAYELMNEAVADDPEQWNNLVAEAVKRIRTKETDRLIVIGSNKWQSADTFDVLKVPDDKNIILSFHFYEPFLLSHYHASWTNLRDYTGPVHYPGVLISKQEFDDLDDAQKAMVKYSVDKEWNIGKIEEMMELPLRIASEKKLRLYCGEYGIIDGAPEEDKIRWYSDMTTVFKKHGIASANWNYKSGSFGLVSSSGVKNQPVINAIFNK